VFAICEHCHLRPGFALCEYVRVHVITRRRLSDFWANHPEAKASLTSWYKVICSKQWKNLAELQTTFPSADYVAPYVVFNVGGNKYRVVAKVEFRFGKVFIAEVFTHAEYDRWNADR
jgi:mRNA interferase HigB